MIFSIPAEGILDLSTEKSVIQETGEALIFIDKIVYLRRCTNGTGLIRMQTGVDYTITKEWYEVLKQTILSTQSLNNKPPFFSSKKIYNAKIKTKRR